MTSKVNFKFIMKKNPLLIPLIYCALAAIFYCIVFHQERDKVEELKNKLYKLQTGRERSR